jgi:hypothetical protein
MAIDSVVSVLIANTKFTHGAEVVLLLLPALAVALRKIRRHYQLVAAQMSLQELQPPQEDSQPTALLPVAGVYKQAINALQYARLLSYDVRAVYIELDSEATLNIRRKGRSGDMECL